MSQSENGEKSKACCVCMKPTEEQCTQCQEPCCAEDLKNHRLGEFCQPWRVEEMEGVGRILVASRDISAWEKVVYDEAVVVAPADSPVCLGCLSKVDGSITCSKCQWLMCSKDCENSPHHLEECSLHRERKMVPNVSSYGGRHWAYSALAVQRLLLSSRASPRTEKAVSVLMDHWETRRRNEQVCKALQDMVAFFNKCLGLEWVTLGDVQKAFGVLKTNAVGFAGREGRALFPLVSILSHSCYANLEPIEEPNETATFRAKRKIRQGDELSMRYTTCLKSKHIIQELLKKEWLFDCSCLRCSDQTEFNSYFSSKQCSCGQYFLKQEGGADGSSMLVCGGCRAELDFPSQINREKQLLADISNLAEDKVLEIEDSLKKEGYHQNHHIIMAMYMRYLETVDIKDESDLIKVSRCSKRILDVLNLIDPGCTKLIGKYLSLMLEADTRLVQEKKKRGELEDDQYRLGIKQIVQGKLMAAKLQSKFCK